MGSSPVSPTIYKTDYLDNNSVYDVVIIGAGPAGLSSALYCKRAGIKVLVLEKSWAGGKLNKTLYIENYPGYKEINGPKLGEYMFEQIKELNVEFLIKEVVDIKKNKKLWEILDSENVKYQCKSILIASGMKERVLDIPNVDEYYGKGVSYCAICDGNLYKNKNVIVVGGGNSAVEESLYLADITGGVNLIHRRKEYRAEKIFVDRMKKHQKIAENTPYIPIEVCVKNQKVTGLKIENVENKNKKIISGDCVFFYIGLIPEIPYIKNINLELNENGFIKINENMETSVAGIFAAGDVTDKNLRQVVTATNDGAIAAISIKNYLNNLKN